MTDFATWQVLVFRDGGHELHHTVCGDDYDLLGVTLADLIRVAEHHECTGRQQVPRPQVVRCVHGAPVDKCRQHGDRTVTIPIVR